MFIGDIDGNQLQPKQTKKQIQCFMETAQRRNKAIQNVGAQTKYSLSTYTDDEIRLLVTIANEESTKGTGLKWR